MTDKRLADQVKALLGKMWLTDVELLEIEKRVKQAEMAENTITNDTASIKE